MAWWQINDAKWRFNYGRMATIGRLKKLRVDPPPFGLPIVSNIEGRLIEFKKRLTELWEIKTIAPTIEEKFRSLAIRWKVERDRFSTASKMALHPSYKEIIGMGTDAIPLIISELYREPDHWFIALHTLTGVTESENKRGKIKEMAEVWKTENKKGIIWKQ